MTYDIEVAQIGTGQITCEGDVIRCGGNLLYVLNDGETWQKLADRGGVLVTHVNGEVTWVKLENGTIVGTPVTPVREEGKS